MKPYRIGVIGLGDISGVYIENLKQYPAVELSACAARDPGKARAAAARHGIPKYAAAAEELLADEKIDIILNLTPPAAHAGLNLKALQAGKHLYTEKPLAATFAEGRRIMAAAQERGLMVGCAPDTFLGGRLQTCRRLIDEGRIGNILGGGAFVVSHGHEWHHPDPDFFYKPGGGPLLDIGPYYVTALVSLLGPAVRCSAMAVRGFPERTIETEPRRGERIEVEVDTHIAGTIEFAGGAVVSLIASFDVWDSELPRMELYGTKGTICLNDIDPLDGPNLFGGPVLLKTRDEYRWTALPRPEQLTPWVEVPVSRRFSEVSHRRNSRGIGLVDMALALREGREPRASGTMALHTLEIMEGMLTSAREGRFCRLETTFTRPEPIPPDFLS